MSKPSDVIEDKKTRRQAHRCKKGKGSMFQWILSFVPFPRLFGDIVKQVDLLADAVGSLRSPYDPRRQKQPVLSEYSAHRRRQDFHNFAKLWKAHDPKLTLMALRRGHVWLVIDAWLDQGKAPGSGRPLSAGRIINLLANLRALAAFARLDVHDIVPSNHEVLSYMERGPRVFVDGRDKSLEGNGVDFWEVYRRAWVIDPRVAVVFLLAWLFGLRMEEAYKWRSHLDYAEAGSRAWIFVRRGAKNGKQRGFMVPLTADVKLAVLLAKRFASAGTGCLIPDGIEEKTFRARLYRVAKQVGLTRATGGVTPHGLRHSFARRRHAEELACRYGHRDPCLPPKPEQDYVARLATSECLGHHRVGITAVYLGPPRQPLDG